MARKFKELLDKMPPERRATIKEGANRLRSEMALDELKRGSRAHSRATGRNTGSARERPSRRWNGERTCTSAA